VLVYHGTFCINSLAHVSGSKRYVTGDDSRNNWLLAIFTMGEGWHNNHHAYPRSARHGMKFWELDFTWMMVRVLSLLRLARDVRLPEKGASREMH
jgi:stearoyl-CoA desaturase (delta-9 desaturase)